MVDQLGDVEDHLGDVEDQLGDMENLLGDVKDQLDEGIAVQLGVNRRSVFLPLLIFKILYKSKST